MDGIEELLKLLEKDCKFYHCNIEKYLGNKVSRIVDSYMYDCCDTCYCNMLRLTKLTDCKSIKYLHEEPNKHGDYTYSREFENKRVTHYEIKFNNYRYYMDDKFYRLYEPPHSADVSIYRYVGKQLEHHVNQINYYEFIRYINQQLLREQHPPQYDEELDDRAITYTDLIIPAIIYLLINMD